MDSIDLSTGIYSSRLRKVPLNYIGTIFVHLCLGGKGENENFIESLKSFQAEHLKPLVFFPPSLTPESKRNLADKLKEVV